MALTKREQLKLQNVFNANYHNLFRTLLSHTWSQFRLSVVLKFSSSTP